MRIPLCCDRCATWLCTWLPVLLLLLPAINLLFRSNTEVKAATFHLHHKVNTSSFLDIDDLIQDGGARVKRDFDFFGFDDSSSSSAKGYAKLEWKHCGNKNDVIILRNIQMTPNPIKVPGKVYISFEMDVKENQTAPIKLRVEMKKKIPMLFGFHTWFPVPCYSNGLGSCVIEDICDTEKLNYGKCPKEFEEQDISCKCPILQGTYSFPPIEQDVPDPPPDIDPILMEGEFQVKFSLHKEHKRLTCYETNAVINL